MARRQPIRAEYLADHPAPEAPRPVVEELVGEPQVPAAAAVHAEGPDGRCSHPKCRGEGWPCVPAQSLGLA